MKGALLVAALASLLADASVLHLPASRRAPTLGASFAAQKGYGIPHRSSSKSQDASPLRDDQDILYLVNITLGGLPFTCQIDTGSSDLWVITQPHQNVKTVNTSDVVATIFYADGSGVTGPVDFAELMVGGHTVKSQAFINPTNTTDLDQLLGGPDTGMNCLIGLSFDGLSVVDHNIIEAFGKGTTIGQTPLSNIFQQTRGIDTSLDIHLQRSVDLEQTESGQLFIGEHNTSPVDVTKQKHLPTVSDSQWVVEVDAIKLNGKSLDLGKSALPALKNSKNIGGLLDSGTSALVLPDAIVGEVFASIPGAFFDEGDGVFIVPCLQSANLSITMGGVDYPIHPLDLTRIIEVELPINGKNVNSTVCTGFVDPVGDSCGDGCDMIMGDVFLRNAITSFHFGQNIHSKNFNEDSFVQVAPLTKFADAWSDFINTRTENLKTLAPEPPIDVLQGLLGSNPSSSSPSGGSSPASGGASKALSDDPPSSADYGSSSQLVSLAEKYGPVIIGLLAGNVLIGVALLAIGLVVCTRRGTEKTRSVSPTYAPVRFKEADSGVDASYHD